VLDIFGNFLNSLKSYKCDCDQLNRSNVALLPMLTPLASAAQVFHPLSVLRSLSGDTP
jgi:hypothetical protein